uniref:Uncharacterized protein n=1 Tax=Cynoglossus semilaevis TaxID=244447 RepID=A0A3P8UW38_CYNSE
MGRFLQLHSRSSWSSVCRPGVTNIRPGGQNRPGRQFSQEHLMNFDKKRKKEHTQTLHVQLYFIK